MAIRNTVCILIITYACMTNVAFAQTGDGAEQLNSVETIEVQGVRPLSFFKEQYELSRVALFDSFNELIEDPDLHYVCKRQRKKNSRMVETVCRDAFDIRIREELFAEEVRHAENLITGIGKGAASAQLGTLEIKELKETKAQLIDELANESEDFRQVIINFNKAKYYYEMAHARKFGALSEHSTSENGVPENNSDSEN